MTLKSIFLATAAAGLVLATVPSFAAIGDRTINNQEASRSKAGVGPVIYPHARHEKRYKCADCHPKIFKDKKGENPITMKANMDQKFCGSPNCHNSQKAFPLYECAKCHTNVKAATKKK